MAIPNAACVLRRLPSCAIDRSDRSLPDSQQPITDILAQPMTPKPLEGALNGADDRLLLNHWMPPQTGIVARIPIGERWFSVLWAVPIGTTALIFLIAAAQSLCELPSVKAFIKHYPGIA